MKSEQFTSHQSVEDKNNSSGNMNLIDYFTQQRTKCIKNNSGYYVCIEKKCKRKNPFICYERECQCSENHEECTQKKLKSYLNAISSNNSYSIEIQKKVDQILNDIIDQISDQKDKFIKQIQNGKTNKNFSTDKQQNLFLNAIEKNQQTLTGQILYQILYSDTKQTNYKKFNDIMTKIQSNTNKFKNQQLKLYFNTLEKLIFNDSSLIYWNKELTGDGIEIDGRKVKAVKPSTGKIRFCLLEPSITSMIGDRIQYRIKIVNLGNWIGVGICLRDFITKNKFCFQNYTNAQHGCYIISHNVYTWAYKNTAYNSNMNHGMGMQTGDTILIEIDKKQKIISFKNQTKNTKTSLPISQYIQQNNDQYHICVGLYDPGNEIELIGDVETQSINYKFLES